ncbi:MAG TPA: hypothetical protein VMW01_02775 [Williamwhitmania sp.]|jgi:hypothetical protein|nr:hypothetical protein [Williamwhitmania sp.]
MDTSVLIIGIIIVSLVLVPIMLISSIISIKEKRLKRAFKEQCITHQLIITDPEVFKHKIIGIDPVAKVLLFVNNQVENQKSKTVNLTEVSSCRVACKTEKNNELPHSHEETILKVDLILTNNLTPQEEILVNFFDVNHDNPFEAYPMNDKAMEWQRQINKHIKVPEKVMARR